MKAHLRDRVLSEWRGLPQKSPPPDRTKPVNELLERVLRNLGLQEHVDESQVQGAWADIVGEFIANHSRPVRLRGGVLHIQVLQPTIRFELERTWKTEILKKLKARFGKKIREIRFGLG